MLLKVQFYEENWISSLPRSGASVEDKVSKNGWILLLMQGRKIRLRTVTHMSNHLLGQHHDHISQVLLGTLHNNVD